jgi:hypothetical protein
MNITFNELREIKHKLPTGSVRKIASQLNISEQTVRSYFGASKFGEGNTTGNHWQPGPDGGIVSIEDASILEAAMQILHETPNASRA